MINYQRKIVNGMQIGSEKETPRRGASMVTVFTGGQELFQKRNNSFDDEGFWERGKSYFQRFLRNFFTDGSGKKKKKTYGTQLFLSFQFLFLIFFSLFKQA